MADVEHSLLTGSDLHEPKGIAAASANRVYVADGAGSGSWTTVGNSVLATEAKAFQGGLLHIQDQKASGTAAGSFTSSAWRTRTLNTVLTNEVSGASLASNQITLPEGTYFLQAAAVRSRVGSAKLKWRNVTDSSDVLHGLGCNDGLNGDNTDVISGRFTIASSKVFELQHYCTTNGNFGTSVSSGVVEVYADVRLWKVG